MAAVREFCKFFRQNFTFFAREAMDPVITTAKFLCALQITNSYLITPAMAYGPSMLPTLSIMGDLLLVEKISHRFGKLGPGDIVFFRDPENPRKICVKRLVAMEGQTVSYAPYQKDNDWLETTVVPKGHVWIEGDNPSNSRDSRVFGPVPYGLIGGRVFWRIWPAKEFGPIGQKVE